ncbi:NAD(P)H-dependent oxidoreductase [Propionispora vibrioides]|uniref:NADPH-dependent FMN reductase n=1 Tax=Propionispora vibrioides TaxID=112903 RepID=A0A1H8UV15_9FIRM|nr:NAD(P)H-dependent oxidoreductase [Propionispora vibrioides]SEP06833.1 NADPH-dependent FMN reductase [Propionispora vibrioides]
MKITVLHGSPKGDISVTMQYIRFLQQQFPEHTFTVWQIAQQSRLIEQDEARFKDILRNVAEADGILWSFPLYYYLVPAQYKRFIELIRERQAEEYFQGKYTAVLTTSIHFFDHTAHNYMHAIADDLAMKYYGGYSAAMQDLLQTAGQQRLTLFARNFLAAIASAQATAKAYLPLIPVTHAYTPALSQPPLDPQGRKILILHDALPSQTNLTNMLTAYAASYSQKPDIINLRDLSIKGGCLGCIRCAYDNTCVYGNKDDFITFFNTKVKPADIIIMAGAIHDRYLSSRWKTFFDRSFFNNHVPALKGKQLGFIVSGPLAQLTNLRQILEAYTELQEANIAGIVTDEPESAASIDKLLYQLAKTGIEHSLQNYLQPPSFLSVGGHKIFRDAIWGELRFPFIADHQYYKQNGRYDFPHRQYASRLFAAILSVAAKLPFIRRQLYSEQIKEHMIKPFQRIFQ